MKAIYLKSALKYNSFDVTIGRNILFFRVSVSIEPGRSLLQFRYHELFDFVSITFGIKMKLILGFNAIIYNATHRSRQFWYPWLIV